MNKNIDQNDINLVDGALEKMPVKYIFNQLVDNRILDGTIYQEFGRPEYQQGKKKIGQQEKYAENLDILDSIRDKYCQIFDEMVKEKIEEDEFKVFENIIEDWKDSKRKRFNDNVNSLRSGANNYMKRSYNIIYCSENVSVMAISKLKEKTIQALIDIGAEILEKIFEEFVQGIDSSVLNTNRIMIHRGMNIKDLINFDMTNSDCYIEQSHLTSYSMSINVAEQFSIMHTHKKILLSSFYHDFYKRTIISSLYYSKLDCDQYELITIPPWHSLYFLKEHSPDNTYEYFVGSDMGLDLYIGDA